MRSSRYWASIAAIVMSYGAFHGAAVSRAQTPDNLTARELFYTPVPKKATAGTTQTGAPATPPTSGRATAKPVTPTKPAAGTASAKENSSRTRRPATRTEPVESIESTEPPVRPSQPETKPGVVVKDPGELSYRKGVRKPGRNSGSQLQNVALETEAERPPLALRYSLLKSGEDGYREVDPESVFRSGDSIRVSVESNDDAYLYIVQQGSSKAWSVLFPNEDVDGGSNHVERGRSYIIPGTDTRFTFDEQPGSERLFIVLSRKAEPDLEKLIYAVTDKTPAPESPRPKMLLAGNRIDDAMMTPFRSQLVSRDLVFERVSDDKPAPGRKTEKAMYYATRDRSENARIVVELQLKHQ